MGVGLSVLNSANFTSPDKRPDPGVRHADGGGGAGEGRLCAPDRHEQDGVAISLRWRPCVRSAWLRVASVRLEFLSLFELVPTHG
jgi:hypothetical protein